MTAGAPGVRRLAELEGGAPVFETRGLAYRYPRAPRSALVEVTLEVPGASFVAVLGPNGSGKSTLLRVLLGLRPPHEGQALYRGVPVTRWPRRALAREVGVVPQSEELPFPLTVGELVGMGRYPHLGPWRAPAAEDRNAVQRALGRCDAGELRDRPLGTLSGGERQRVRIARALAQEPRVLVLDEPTASLDIRHEMGIFLLLRRLQREGVTILLVTHNLNLAARFADRLVLLQAGRVAASGPPAAVLTRAIVEGVYGWPVAVARHAGPGPDAGAPQVVPLSSGEPAGAAGSPGTPDYQRSEP